jgi:hypothetical protein
MGEISADTIRNVKTEYVRSIIKETSWERRSRIQYLVSLERFILNDWVVHGYAGAMLRHQIRSNSTAHRCIVEELVQCDWLPEERKATIQRIYQAYLEGIQTREQEDIQRDRERRLTDRLADEEALKAWTEAGGL